MTRFLAKLCRAGLCACALSAAPASAEDAAPAALPSVPTMEAAAKAPALVGTLTDADLWRAYKAKFVTDGGRVVDTANAMVSHTEGQGYGLLLAVAANDRPTFERIWGWTRANLAVRNDELLAWRWEPDHRPAVADLNDAADGDILIAWALAEAADAWSEDAYRVAGPPHRGRGRPAAHPVEVAERRRAAAGGGGLCGGGPAGRADRQPVLLRLSRLHPPPAGRAGVRLGGPRPQRVAPHRGGPVRRAESPRRMDVARRRHLPSRRGLRRRIRLQRHSHSALSRLERRRRARPLRALPGVVAAGCRTTSRPSTSNPAAR